MVRVWIDLCGVYVDNDGSRRWEYLFDGNPIFDGTAANEDAAWLMQEAVWLAKKGAMAEWVHATHPKYMEVDINYSITDGEYGWPLGDEDFTEILYIDEN